MVLGRSTINRQVLLVDNDNSFSQSIKELAPPFPRNYVLYIMGRVFLYPSSLQTQDVDIMLNT